jgi:hypothetical protein
VRVLPVADWRTTTLNRALRAVEPSVVHFPFEMPARLSLPSVFTLHDPGRYLYPELMVRKVWDVQNDRLRRQLSDPNLRAAVTVSHASQADIAGVLGELPCPLVVVPNFVSADFAQRLLRWGLCCHGSDTAVVSCCRLSPSIRQMSRFRSNGI